MAVQRSELRSNPGNLKTERILDSQGKESFCSCHAVNEGFYYARNPRSMNILSNPILIIVIALGILFIFAFVYFITRKSGQQASGPDKLEELYRKLSEEIKYAVAPKSINLNASVTELVELATEVWRIEQRLAKVADILPENQRKGLENSVHKFKRYISNYDIEIVDYTNQKFNDGLNLDVLSVEKDQSVMTPTVKETVEPTILVKGQVVKKAKIILLSN